jgi:hypothetical protein
MTNYKHGNQEFRTLLKLFVKDLNPRNPKSVGVVQSSRCMAPDPNHGESHFGKTKVRSAQISPEMSQNVNIHLGHLIQRGCVAPDPRDHDFTTQRFEHGA